MSNGFARPETAPAMGESLSDVVLPHLDAGYRLARRLIRNEHGAEDMDRFRELLTLGELKGHRRGHVLENRRPGRHWCEPQE